MPAQMFIAADGVPPEIETGLADLRAELGVPDAFPPEVEAAAAQAAKQPRLPQKDMTDIAFLTIDPETSMDLDQAMFIQREGDGYLVYYAIADVAAWVDPGGPIDVEAHKRGQTFYGPNSRALLHPAVLSEGAASLLAEDPPRPALVWQLRVDAEGNNTQATVERALVRNRQKLSYVGVQADLDSGKADDTINLLREVGKLREAQEKARGGISLPIPEQEVHTDDGQWHLEYRTPLPVEGWNAQISLMTGMAAAKMMVDAKVGVLRTLPPVDDQSLAKLRQKAKALGIAWPQDMTYPDFVRSLDPAEPVNQAMLNQCTMLFRGAGYMAFNGELPDQNYEHNALATIYAHTTAPLRRLVDRYVGEICVALCANQPVPQWVLDALDALPPEMQDSDHREKKYERGIVDFVEALVLKDRVGQEFSGVVVNGGEQSGRGTIMITDPAIEAPVNGNAPFGAELKVRLVEADTTTGKVTFESERGGGQHDGGQRGQRGGQHGQRGGQRGSWHG